jgi:hypothetical protein
LDNFYTWFVTGLTHITDPEAYDHILFLLALCITYTIGQWKSLLILVTAFTLGHCLTLALSVLNLIRVNNNLVEIMIPVTIILTCVYNIKNRNELRSRYIQTNYLIAFLFGLVHGLGFSSLIKSLLGPDQNILSPLFAFNLGLEAGQLIILAAIILFSVALTRFFKMQLTRLVIYVSVTVLVIGFGIAGSRLIEMIK